MLLPIFIYRFQKYGHVVIFVSSTSRGLLRRKLDCWLCKNPTNQSKENFCFILSNFDKMLLILCVFETKFRQKVIWIIYIYLVVILYIDTIMKFVIHEISKRNFSFEKCFPLLSSNKSHRNEYSMSFS